MSDTIYLVDPTISDRAASVVLAPRPQTLDGLRIGLLANGKTYGDAILDRVFHELAKRWRVSRVPLVTKAHPSDPPSPEQFDALIAGSDIVISAVGDCGSCSSCSVVDAIHLERAGVPSAVIVTEPFLPTVRAIADLNGAPDFDVAVLPHPVTSLFLDQLDQRILDVSDQVESILLGRVSVSAIEDPDHGDLLDPDAVAKALAPLLVGLRADGADLTIDSISGTRVRLSLTVRDASCYECMLPAEQLGRIASAALSRHFERPLVAELISSAPGAVG